MLVGTIIIRATQYHSRHLVRPYPSVDQLIACGLGRRVWAGRIESRLLVERFPGICGSVHFVGRYVDKTLYLAVSQGVNEIVSPENVALKERSRVRNTSIHMSLSCKMNHQISILRHPLCNPRLG